MLAQAFETKVALGSDATIVLIADNQRKLQSLFAKLWRQVYRFELQFSRFLPASELSVFNRSAGIHQPISEEFRRLLLGALEMADLSDGLYNPFILPALQRAGYQQSALPGYEHDRVDDHSRKTVVGADQLIVTDTYATIPYGTALDMGGCGKGYLADELADTLEAEQLAGYWISLGGDMVVAGTDETGRPWNVSIQSADSAIEDAPYIVRTSGQRLAVATSGTFRRSTQPGKKAWHHLIDPRTGEPAATDIRLATVIDGSALRADVLASCAAIVSSTQVFKYLRARHVEGAFIQAEHAGSIEVTKFGKAVKSVDGGPVHV